MAYDKATNQVILFGSSAVSSTPATPETWAWTPNGGWGRLAPAVSPPARTWPSMAYDEARQRVVLFGGQSVVPVNGTELPALNDTWTWDGRNWNQEHSALSPPATVMAPIAYDPGQRNVILLRDNLQSPTDATGVTWKWEGSNWSSVQTAGYRMAPKQWAGLAYDARAGELALYGTGAYIIPDHPPLDGSVWTFRSGAWTRHQTSNGPSGGRSAPAMAQDARGRVVVFGGESANDPSQFLNDTWVWDQGTWTSLSTAHAPAGRSEARMVFDASCGIDVLYGGATFSPNSGRDYFDTWVFDGSNWKLAG